MIRTTIAILILAGVVAAEDSPLVALAKRTNRQASKTRVITNETVAASKGRVSMASSEGAPLPPLPAEAAPVAPTTQAKDTVPSGPALQPPPPPPGSARSIAPQSSAQITAPQSSAQTITPSAAAPQAQPASSAGTIQPQSTVRNLEPQAAKPPQL